MDDKNSSIIEYLLECPYFAGSSLFFNFAEEDDGTNQFIKIADDTNVSYVDGSKLKTYTFNIISYKSVSHSAIIPEFDDENMSELAEVQAIINWINEQDENHNYPNFGEGYHVDSIKCLTNDPNLFGLDTESDPPLAKYSIVIQIEYLDKTKMLFS